MQEAVHHRIRQVYLGELVSDPPQVLQDIVPILRAQTLLSLLGFLRRVKAEPNLADLVSRRPEQRELLEVFPVAEQAFRNRTMHGNRMAGDVLEDAAVCRWSAPQIVLRLKAVNLHHQLEVLDPIPACGDRPNGTGDQLHLAAKPAEFRQEFI